MLYPQRDFGTLSELTKTATREGHDLKERLQAQTRRAELLEADLAAATLDGTEARRAESAARSELHLAETKLTTKARLEQDMRYT